MKEKLDTKMLLSVQKSLYKDFNRACEGQYKTKSEVVRNFMLEYVKEYGDEKNANNRRICKKSSESP